MLKHFLLATRLFWRDWRSGEWLIIFLALVLAITAITSVHFYTERLTRGLEEQGAEFLGGDLAISSPTPLATEWINYAHQLRLKTAEVWSYPSVVSANQQLQLVNIQAVSAAYPILPTKQSTQPKSHTIWVEPRLLPLLSVTQATPIHIGAATFTISQLLTANVDNLNTGWAIAPRVMMRLSDVPATKTVIPGSRVDYRLLVAGNPQQVAQFQQWVLPKLSAAQHILDIHTQQTGVRNLLERAENYLQLILLVCLLMSGIAIGLSTQQYLRRHASYVALWRCLGAKYYQITGIFFCQLCMLSIMAGMLGCLLGFLVQYLFSELFQTLLQFSLPSPGWRALWLGFITSIVLLFTFAYPVLLNLPLISPLVIWRNPSEGNNKARKLYFFIAAGGLLLCVAWFMQFSTLVMYFMLVMLSAIVFLYGLSSVIFAILRCSKVYLNGVLKRGVSQLLEHLSSVRWQFIGFSLILTSLLVLGLIRNDLIAEWQQSLSKQTPNYFAFNIATTDLNPLQLFFQQHHLTNQAIYPMVRGRLVSLNNQPIMQAVPASALNNNALHRELNLSSMQRFPSDNKIISGRPWDTQDKGKLLISVENQLAKDLHLHLGDYLTFQLGDQQIKAQIQSIRSVEWGSFHPNFFVIFPAAVFANYPTTYITSFHLGAEETTILNQLIQQFPNITILDVAGLLAQMQVLLGKITLALQGLFLYALGAGLLIFITSLQASMDERRLTYRLLRVLGASKRFLFTSVLVEFSILSMVILLSSGLLGYAIAKFLAYWVFSL